MDDGSRTSVPAGTEDERKEASAEETARSREGEGERGRRLYRLEDLARIAGVSVSTVSRALRDSPLVAEATKRRIFQLARMHDFRGRTAARSQALGRTPALSVVVPPPQGRDRRVSDPFLLELLGALADSAMQHDCDLLISHIMPADEVGTLEILEHRRTDGVIFLGQSTIHRYLNAYHDRGVPFVVWGAELPDQRYVTVGSDNRRGGARATRHLLRLERRRIAFIGNTEAPEIALRFQGYRAALEEAGVAFDPALFVTADLGLDSGMEAIQRLIDAETGVDAVVAASDLLALGIIQGAKRRGLSVPEDLAVVGYDDIQLAAYASPALTTIRQNVTLGGRLLLRKLLALLRGETVASECLPTELIVRESCGA